jgi:hypothetical protein
MLAPKVQTADGWLGFDPGAAQAGSTGVLRLRWLPPNAQVSREPGCEVLPLVMPIAAGTCYLMVQEELPVQSGPSDRSPILTVLQPDGYIAVTGETADGWLQIDLDRSSSPQSGIGWVRSGAASFSGPCSDLPGVES